MVNLSKYRNSKGQIYLNVASSAATLEGFVNLDNHIFLRVIALYPIFKVVIPNKYRSVIEKYHSAAGKTILLRHDCRARLCFPDNSVDHILCSHFLEHVHSTEAIKILEDFHRVLRPKATLHVIVPDLEIQAQNFLNKSQQGIVCAADDFVRETLLSKEAPGSFKFRFLEFFGGFGLQHRWMYDHASMRIRLEKAGFEILAKNETPSADYRRNDGSVHLVARK